MTSMTLQAVRQLIADDSYAITFQSVEQYRAALLRHFDNLVGSAPPFATGGVVPGTLNLAGDGLRPLPAHAGGRPGGAAVTLDEAVYALDLVVNKMGVPGLSGQRAFALDVLKRAEAPAGVLPNAAWVRMGDPRDYKLAEPLATAPDAPGTPEAPDTRRLDLLLNVSGFHFEIIDQKEHLLNARGCIAGIGATKRDAIDDALGIPRAAQFDGGQSEEKNS